MKDEFIQDGLRALSKHCDFDRAGAIDFARSLLESSGLLVLERYETVPDDDLYLIRHHGSEGYDYEVATHQSDRRPSQWYEYFGPLSKLPHPLNPQESELTPEGARRFLSLQPHQGDIQNMKAVPTGDPREIK